MGLRDDFVKIPEIKIGDCSISTGVNLLKEGREHWDFYTFCDGEAYLKYGDNSFIIDITNTGDANHAIQLVQGGIKLEQGNSYRIDFDVYSEVPRHFGFAVSSPDRAYRRYLKDQLIILDGKWETHRVTFEMLGETDENARIEFNLGNNDSTGNVEIRNVRLQKVNQDVKRRGTIGVCGGWEDAENYNLFLSSLMIPEITDNYVIMSYTFPESSIDEDETDTGLKFTDFISMNDFDAVIVFAQMLDKKEIQDRIIANCKSKQIPLFFLEQEREGVINCILNYAGGFEKMVEHVLDYHKCTKVKMLAGFKGNPYSIEREEVFKNQMLKHGIMVNEDDIIYGDFWDAATVQRLNILFDAGMEVPEAFVCANDSMAVGVCDCLESRGIRVPEDVIVTGFDGTWHGKYHKPVISTAVPDYESLGQYIIGVIKGEISWKPGKSQRYSVDYKVSLNDSCGCASDEYDWRQKVKTLVADNQDYFRHMLEMGKFISRTISLNDMDEAMMDLQHYLWLWKKQYYFAGITNHEYPGYVDTVLHGNGGEYAFNEKYYNLTKQLPELDEILEPGSGINILLFRQIRHAEKAYGYVSCGYEKFTMRDQQRFEEFVLYVSAVVISVMNNIKLLEANKAIGELSEKDYLTGLYNRRGFLRHVNELMHDPKNVGKIFSLFSIDMDGLKYINDTYGHQEGDNSLIVMARALNSFIGEKGICARFGGDEFAIAAVGDIDIGDGLVDMRKRLAIHTSGDPRMQGRAYEISASIGIAECIISGKDDLEDIMRLSDIRMYKDKQKRKEKSSR